MLKKLKKIWIEVQNRSKMIELPLFEGLSLFDVLSFFFKGIAQGRITNRASSIAYSFFLALFPGILFLFSLIAYFPVEGLDREVFDLLRMLLPPDTFESAQSTIDDILKHKRPDLLSFGFLFTLYFATNGINSLVSNFGDSIHQLQKRGFIHQQLVSIGLTIYLAFIFLIGITIIIFSSDVLNSLLAFFKLESVSSLLIDLVRYLLMILLTLLTIAILYNIGPSRGREWRFISPGAILATFLILVTSFGFSFYVSNFNQYNKLYGSIGTVMIILLWIYINALLLIIGFELNASIASAKSSNQQLKI